MKVLPLGGRKRDRVTTGQSAALDALLARWRDQRLGTRRQRVRLLTCLGRLALLKRKMAWNRHRLRASRIRLQRALTAL